MHLDSTGLPTAAPRFVVLAGSDQNDYLTGTQVSPGNPHPNGGRPALTEVQSIDNPESTSAAWTTGALPSLNIARIYTNAVVLPDEQLFVVGGSHFNYLPFAGQSNANVWMRERIASPIFFPEMIDLANVGGWVLCQQHVSPRLYHCMALLLPDGRVLVCGGYRGKIPAPNTPIGNMLPEERTWYDWREQHSDIEIYSPDYLLMGSARPQILSITGGNTIGYCSEPGSTFEVTMAFPGQSNPAQAIGSVCLISPGSLTHHYDWDQRFVGLTATVTATNKLSIVAPADPNVAPPGMYMLFITSNPALTGGVKIPSVAAYVNLQ